MDEYRDIMKSEKPGMYQTGMKALIGLVRALAVVLAIGFVVSVAILWIGLTVLIFRAAFGV